MIYFILIIIGCILLFIALSRFNDKNNPIVIVNKSDIAKFKIEYPNRKRILEDSIHLIKNTENIETFSHWLSELKTQYYWIQRQRSKGIKVDDKYNDNYIINIYRISNINLLRIANAYHDKYIMSLNEGKQSKTKKERTVQALFQCIDNLQDYDDKDSCKMKIESLIDDVSN